MPGPPPKPDELRILEGTFRADRHGDPTTEVVAEGVPEAPAHLRGEALSLWRAVVPELIATGLAHGRDCAQLTAMCEWWGRYRKLSAALDRMGADNERYSRTEANAALAYDRFDKVAARFGLTAADRTKMRQPVGRKRDGGVASRKRG